MEPLSQPLPAEPLGPQQLYWPSAQYWQLCARYMLPEEVVKSVDVPLVQLARHSAHPSALKRPFAQVWQLVLPTPLAYRPGAQASQAPKPLAFVKKPAAQGVHVAMLVAAAAAPYFPEAHCVQEREPSAAQEPCAQHTAAPAELLVPPSHARQPLSAPTPVALWNVLAGQAAQAEASAAKKNSL